MKQHRERGIELARKQSEWAPGTDLWEQDKELILFYAQCLDRPAFRTYFHQELSFSDFDRAMEDTLLALNTGYWRTREGVLIDRGKGKVHLVSPEWRKNLDQIADCIEAIRRRFREALGLNEELVHWRFGGPASMHDWMEDRFRDDRRLGKWMDEKRNEAVELMNALLREIGQPELPSVR